MTNVSVTRLLTSFYVVAICVTGFLSWACGHVEPVLGTSIAGAVVVPWAALVEYAYSDGGDAGKPDS